MKRILLSAALAAVAAPAFAGDLLPPPPAPPPPAYAGPIAAPVPAPEPPPVPVKAAPAIDWSGSWVGGVLQYSAGSVTGNDSDFTLLQQSLRPSVDGFMGGIATGYNYQYNQWVFGVVGDIQGGSITGSRSDAQPMGLVQADKFFNTNVFTGTTNVAAKLDTTDNWLATVRGRLGYAWYGSPFMVYGTGGVAFGDVGMRVSANGVDGAGNSSAFALSASHTLVGFAVGAGTEWMLDRNFSLGAEYLYVQLEKATYFQNTLGVGVDGGLMTHNFRLSLNYHF